MAQSNLAYKMPQRCCSPHHDYNNHNKHKQNPRNKQRSKKTMSQTVNSSQHFQIPTGVPSGSVIFSINLLQNVLKQSSDKIRGSPQCHQTPAFSVMLDGTLSFQPQYCCPRSHCDRVPHWLVQLPLTRAPYHLHHHQSSFLTHIIIIILTQDKTHMHPQHISVVSVSLVHWLTEAAVMVSAIWCWIRGKPPSPVGFLCGVWGWLMICTWISGLSSLQTLRP